MFMIRIQEVCKQKGLTMQELAKRMGTTYQALYAASSGNPTIGKLKDIADALEGDVTELFEQSKCNTTTLSCPHCGKSINIKVE